MSHKKPQEKNANAPPSEGKPPLPDGPAKDPFAEAAAKLEQDGAKLEQELNQAGPTTSTGDLKPEGVKITDLPDLSKACGTTDPLSTFAEHGLAAQAQADSVITYTAGDEKKGDPLLVKIPAALFTDDDPEALAAWVNDVVPKAVGRLVKHRDYFMAKKPVNGITVNPFGPALDAVVRLYNSFNTSAGNRGLKSE